MIRMFTMLQVKFTMLQQTANAGRRGVRGTTGITTGQDALRSLKVQGYLAHKKHPRPKDHYRSLGIGLP